MVNPASLPVLRTPPEAWEIPPGVVVRRGDVGGMDVIAFTGPRGEMAFGVMGKMLKEGETLPEWIWKKFQPILSL